MSRSKQQVNIARESMINKNSFSLCKPALLWLVVIVLSVTTGAGSAYASAPAPTAGEIVKSAQDYLNGTDNDFPDKLISISRLDDNDMWWAGGDIELDDDMIEGLMDRMGTPPPIDDMGTPPIYEELKGKLVALRSNDGIGNTLAHKIISDGRSDILGYLLSIEGVGVLETKNQNGQLPLSTLSANDKFQVLVRLRRDVHDDEELSRGVSAYVKAHELAPLKRQVSDLIKEIDSLILNFPKEIENWFSDKSRDLRGKREALGGIIELCPSVFEGQKLENFPDFFEVFNQTPEDRAILRGYRTGEGKSLLQYCAEMFLNRERDLWDVKPGIQTILRAYILDGASITNRDWDITEFAPFLLDLILETFGPENAKQFLLNYRNKKGENLAQMCAEKGDLSCVIQMRQMIDDDQEFKELLALTQPGTESADVLLLRTKEGRQFLIGGDPQYSVKADSKGITPLMRDALELSTQEFQRLLEDLRGNGVSVDMNQRDSFGNTVRSLQELKQEFDYNYFLPLLNISFKNLPFKESIWNDIVNFPYRERHIGSREFIYEALGVVSAQPETPLHRAFLQKDEKGQKREANALWRSLLKTYDDLVDEELAPERSYIEDLRLDARFDPILTEEIEGFDKRLSFIKEQRKLPLAARFLAAMRPFDFSEPSPVIDDSAIKVLTGNSTFGINFSRKVTAPEAKIVVDRIRHIAGAVNRHLAEWLDENRYRLGVDLKSALTDSLRVQMRNTFFQDYPFEIDAGNRDRLFAHRMNCAVVALESLWMDYNLPWNFNIGSRVDKFDFIDEQLQTYAPRGMKVNSKARFERLQGLYPDAFSGS